MSQKACMFGSSFVFLVALFLPLETVADELHNQQIQAAIQRAQNSIGTIQISEIVRVERKLSDHDITRARERYLTGIETARQDALAKLGDNPAQTELNRVNNDYDRRAAQVDQHVAAYRANANLHFESVTLVDFKSDRARVEITELRELPETPHPKNESELAFPISKSGVHVETLSGSLKRSEFAPGSVTNSPRTRFNGDEKWLALGVFPAWMVDENRRAMLTEADTNIHKLTVIDPGTPRRVESPSKGAVVNCVSLLGKDDRLLQWVTYNAEGDRFRTIDYGDYRQVDGLWFPFEITDRLDVNDVEGYRVETRTISEIRVNVPVDEAMFQLEAIEGALPEN